MKVFSKSYENTVEIGMAIGKLLCEGDVVCLYGEMGAGKTALAQGIAQGKGFEGFTGSPTFTIVNEYNTIPPIFHFDVYRVFEPDELFEIGFYEYFERRGIVLIEWANLVKEMLPKKYLSISILRVVSERNNENEEDIREIEVIEVGGEFPYIKLLEFSEGK